MPTIYHLIFAADSFLVQSTSTCDNPLAAHLGPIDFNEESLKVITAVSTDIPCLQPIGELYIWEAVPKWLA